jgi:hypothetical protein
MRVLYISNSEPPDPSNPLEHDWSWEGRSPAQFRSVATTFMAACPSLQRLSFAVFLEDDPYSGLADPGHLTYVRSSELSGNVARLDGFYNADSGWWMR